MELTATLVADAKAMIGEGPSWDAEAGHLLWVDIQGKAAHVYNPSTNQDRTIPLPCEPGTIVPRSGGGATVATDSGFAHLDLETGALAPIANPEAANPERRFNDGKCDPRGRFWAGTLYQDLDRPVSEWDPIGVLYRLDGDGSVHSMLRGLTISNGLTWSPLGDTFYFIDSPTMQVRAFDFDAQTGSITNSRVAIEIAEDIGFPDGMTSDEEGMLWIAHFFGGQVTRWNPHTAEMIGRIQVPQGNVTSCVFGGENMDQLYITTARILLDEQQLKERPHAGGLYVASPGVKGVASHAFVG